MKFLRNLILFILFAGVFGVLGWNMATSDDIKALRDANVTQVLPIPRRQDYNPDAERILKTGFDSHLIRGSADNIRWKDVVFEDGLKCRFFMAERAGAQYNSGVPFFQAASCDWETYNDTKEGEG